jgi:hypothetical protein
VPSGLGPPPAAPSIGTATSRRSPGASGASRQNTRPPRPDTSGQLQDACSGVTAFGEVGDGSTTAGRSTVVSPSLTTVTVSVPRRKPSVSTGAMVSTGGASISSSAAAPAVDPGGSVVGSVTTGGGSVSVGSVPADGVGSAVADGVTVGSADAVGVGSAVGVLAGADAGAVGLLGGAGAPVRARCTTTGPAATTRTTAAQVVATVCRRRRTVRCTAPGPSGRTSGPISSLNAANASSRSLACRSVTASPPGPCRFRPAARQGPPAPDAART